MHDGCQICVVVSTSVMENILAESIGKNQHYAGIITAITTTLMPIFIHFDAKIIPQFISWMTLVGILLMAVAALVAVASAALCTAVLTGWRNSYSAGDSMYSISIA